MPADVAAEAVHGDQRLHSSVVVATRGDAGDPVRHLQPCRQRPVIGPLDEFICYLCVHKLLPFFVGLCNCRKFACIARQALHQQASNIEAAEACLRISGMQRSSTFQLIHKDEPFPHAAVALTR